MKAQYEVTLRGTYDTVYETAEDALEHFLDECQEDWMGTAELLEFDVLQVDVEPDYYSQ